MARICVNKSCFAVATESSIIIYSKDEHDKNTTLELPHGLAQADSSEKAGGQKPTNPDVKNTILGIQFSPCGRWLCAFSTLKLLVFWETHDWKVVSLRYLPKTASNLAFTQDCKSVVIVDKSGDALLFPVDNLESGGEIILGHLSMLLDVTISSDDKFIVTSDRDEKIRVSHFPNAYNISSYCLGHTEFVSSLCFLPHNSSILVSGSGDGTIRLWDYQKGLCLTSHDCSLEALQKLSLNTSKKNDGCENTTVPIEKIRCAGLNSSSSLLCVLFYGIPGCVVYSVDDLSLTLLDAVCVKDNVIDVSFGEDRELFVYSMDKVEPVKCFSYVQENGVFSQSNTHDYMLGNMCVALSQLISTEIAENHIVPQLFKRKFDNVKDYYDQKKVRIGC